MLLQLGQVDLGVEIESWSSEWPKDIPKNLNVNPRSAG
jgi:hypothetical protein